MNCFSEENQQEGFLRMPRIYVNFPGLERIGIECGTAASKVDELFIVNLIGIFDANLIYPTQPGTLNENLSGMQER